MISKERKSGWLILKKLLTFNATWTGFVGAEESTIAQPRPVGSVKMIESVN